MRSSQQNSSLDAQSGEETQTHERECSSYKLQVDICLRAKRVHFLDGACHSNFVTASEECVYHENCPGNLHKVERKACPCLYWKGRSVFRIPELGCVWEEGAGLLLPVLLALREIRGKERTRRDKAENG